MLFYFILFYYLTRVGLILSQKCCHPYYIGLSMSKFHFAISLSKCSLPCSRPANPNVLKTQLKLVHKKINTTTILLIKKKNTTIIRTVHVTSKASKAFSPWPVQHHTCFSTIKILSVITFFT